MNMVMTYTQFSSSQVTYPNWNKKIVIQAVIVLQNRKKKPHLLRLNISNTDQNFRNESTENVEK